MPNHKALSDAAMDIAHTTHAELSALLRAVKAAHVSGDGAAINATTAAMVATSQRQSAATTLAHTLARDDGGTERIAALQAIAAGRPVREGILLALFRAGLIAGALATKPRLTEHGANVLALYRELTAATNTEDR